MESMLPYPETKMLVPSSPGGPARQYRVQVRDEGSSTWQLFASFLDPHLAEACLLDLESRNIPARLVAIRICPTSA